MDFADSPQESAFRAEARAWLEGHAPRFSGPVRSEQEGLARAARERVERRHDRVRQQQAIARQHLPLPEHGPARSEPCDEGRVAAGAQGVHAAVDGGRHGARNTK